MDKEHNSLEITYFLIIRMRIEIHIVCYMLKILC
jgi:hypothetical protein